MVIDIIFLIAAAYGFYVGFSRGIIQTVFTILSYVIGLMAAFKFSPTVTQFLETTFNNTNPLMFIAGFILTFVATILLIRLFARGLEGILQTVNVNFVNQVAGGGFMAAVMILVYSILLWFADQSHIIDDQTKRESFTYEYLEKYPLIVWEGGQRLRPVFEDFWDHTIEFMDRVQEMGLERTESNPNIYDLDDDYDYDSFQDYEPGGGNGNGDRADERR